MVNQYISFPLAYTQAILGFISFCHCLQYLPYKQIRHLPSTWTRIQTIHFMISTCVVVQQAGILVEIVLHLIYIYSCQLRHVGDEMQIFNCTETYFDIRQTYVFNPILKCVVVPLFTIAGSCLIFYVVEKYKSMVCTQFSRQDSESSQVPSQSSSTSELKAFIEARKFQIICSTGMALGCWLSLSVFLSDEDQLAQGARLSRIAATLALCIFIIICVGLIESRLLYVVLSEVSPGCHGTLTKPSFQSDDVSSRICSDPGESNRKQSPSRDGAVGNKVVDSSIRRWTLHYFQFLEYVSFWERFKLFFITATVVLVGTFILGLHTWAELAAPSKLAMNYYSPIGLSVATILFNQILAFMAILHRSLLRIRSISKKKARLAATMPTQDQNPFLNRNSALKSSEVIMSQSQCNSHSRSGQPFPLQTTFSAVLYT